MVMLSLLFLAFIPTDEYYTGAFMELGMGARALAIGNAFVGLADDPTAFYWNPAGLTQMKKRHIFIMHSGDFDELVKTNSAAFVQPCGPYTLSIALSWTQIPDIPISDSTASGYQVIEWVTASDYVLFLTYARSFAPVNVGVTVKPVFRDWGTIATAYGIETDVGVLSTFKGVRLGVNLVNLLGSPIYWQDSVATQDQLPMVLRSGCSIQENFRIGRIAVSLGLDTSPERRVAQFTTYHSDAHLGMEYSWQEKFALRAGWDSGIFCGGCGIVYRSLSFDYGMKLHPELNIINRLSGCITF
jgi:hypothetical protein